jgi:ABC-type transport system substrate-binding protein
VIEQAGPWGTGPYRLVKGFSTPEGSSAEVVLEANLNYWGTNRYPRIKRIVFDNTIKQRDAVELVKTGAGRLDLVTDLNPLETLSVAQSPRATVVKSRESIGSVFGQFNMRKAGSPWRDVRLRRAVNLAINRDDLITYATRGNGVATPALLPKPAIGFNPGLAPYPLDVAQARQLVRDAGHPEGLAITLIAPEGWEVLATVVSKMLEGIGLTVDRQMLDAVTYTRKVFLSHLDRPAEQQPWDIAITYWHDPTNFPPFEFYQTHAAGGVSDWLEEQPEFGRLYDDIFRTVDAARQEALMQELERHVHDQAYFLFLYNPILLYAVSKTVTFVPSRTHLLFFVESSLTDQHRSVRARTR